jgi:hypothetical protein
VLVSEEDLEFLSRWVWRRIDYKGNVVGASRSTRNRGYRQHNIIYMHEEVGKRIKLMRPVKHRNGNVFDNRRENLYSEKDL